MWMISELGVEQDESIGALSIRQYRVFGAAYR